MCLVSLEDGDKNLKSLCHGVVIELTPNDTETFRLTGCMSSCEKYHYTADSVYERQWDYNGTNSYRIKFRFSNGKYERKEQVRRDCRSHYWRGRRLDFLCHGQGVIHKSILVLDLWVWWSHRWYWRIPRTATRPKYIWSSSDTKSMVEWEVSKAKVLEEKVGLWELGQSSVKCTYRIPT